MSEECNSYGAFSLLFSLEVKFVHNLQNNTEHFNTLLRSLRLLVNRFTTDHYREIVSGKIYNQHKSSRYSKFTIYHYSRVTVTSIPARTSQRTQKVSSTKTNHVKKP